MIRELIIDNYAIIKKSKIVFNNGLTIITGNTGAGKSIIIDAIEQLLGARASSNMIGDNKDYTFIEGVFDINSNIINLLLENDIDFEDDYLIISKKISRDSKSQFKLNNRIVTSDIIKKIASFLVEIIAQNSSLNILKEGFQLDYIDNLFNKDEKALKKTYINKYNEYNKIVKEYNDFLKNEIDDELLSYYQNQLDEINNNYINEDEYNDLLNKETYYKSFEKISKIFKESLIIFDNNDLLNNINHIQHILSKLPEQNSFTKLNEDIDNIYYHVYDIYNEIKNNYQDMNYDDDEYNLIAEKLFNFNKLFKKYNYSYEMIISKKEDYCNKIDFINNSEKIINQYKDQINNYIIELNEISLELSKIRNKYINDIVEYVNNSLAKLYLKNALFDIKIDDIEDFNNNGKNKITFVFNANKKTDLKVLSQVISGGELSRLMLILASYRIINNKVTYIFDEIDTGVSGETANAIGSMMKELSNKTNVIAITHLAQVAAYAKNHLHISKEINSVKNETVTEYLDENESIECIANMLSAEKMTNTAYQHAKELVNNARKQ